MATLHEEILRRRTFAIISHPDAGKTTLTEKFLLYGGAIAQAGEVKGKRARAATSDWMEIEKQRGISVTSSVMQFQHGGYCINILDTPGHQDFSEDTYRTLMAADSAVMVIDGAKGVEPQTRKLFRVCAPVSYTHLMCIRDRLYLGAESSVSSALGTALSRLRAENCTIAALNEVTA